MSCSYRLPHYPVLAFVLCCSYLVFACEEGDPAKSINGSWKYAFHEDVTSGEISSEPEYIARSVVITFEDNGKKGEFFGQTVTNAIQGEYRIKSDGSISFTEITGGQRGEPDWSAGFWAALDNSSSYSKENERLEITYEEGSKKLIFIPQE
ncbi:MAG: META domain-containing protein [Bacteroidota bacterium]